MDSIVTAARSVFAKKPAIRIHGRRPAGAVASVVRLAEAAEENE